MVGRLKLMLVVGGSGSVVVVVVLLLIVVVMVVVVVVKGGWFAKSTLNVSSCAAFSRNGRQWSHDRYLSLPTRCVIHVHFSQSLTLSFPLTFKSR